MVAATVYTAGTDTDDAFASMFGIFIIILFAVGVASALISYMLQ
jgi:hypothetical protein